MLRNFLFAKVQICVDAFLRPNTKALYINSIERFSVANAKCFVESDRAVLQAKVAEYYMSEEAFERFVKATAIGVIAQTVARKANRGSYETEFAPWLQLAQRCGLDELEAALRRVDPSGWREQAMEEADARCRRAAKEGAGGSGGGETKERTGTEQKSEERGDFFWQRRISFGPRSHRTQVNSPDWQRCIGASSRGWQEIFDAKVDVWFTAEVVPLLHAIKAECVRPARLRPFRLSSPRVF